MQKRCSDNISDDDIYENTMLIRSWDSRLIHAVEGQESDPNDKSKQLLKGKDYKLSTSTYTY